MHWHPFFNSAYSGGGFTLGAGYATFVSPTTPSTCAAASRSPATSGLESEFRAPRLFDRRGVLSVLGGWREATQVGFYGIGTGNTSIDDRANYSFRQPYGARHARRAAGAEAGSCSAAGSSTRSGSRARARARAVGRRGLHARRRCRGSAPSVTYLHAQGTVGLDWRTGSRATPAAAAPTASRSTTSPTPTMPYGFQQVDYEAIQHVPLVRDAWVLSLHGRVRDHLRQETTRRFRSSCCRRSAAARACAGSRAGASAIATACCCRPSGACS